jgi:hypothetical protein
MAYKFGSTKIARKSLPAPAKKAIDEYVNTHGGIAKLGITQDAKHDGSRPDVDLLELLDWRSVLTMGDVAIAIRTEKVCGCGKCNGGQGASLGDKKD